MVQISADMDPYFSHTYIATTLILSMKSFKMRRMPKLRK